MTVILIRTLIFYVMLNLGMRLTGKRQIGEIQLAEFVSAIMLSELALLPITDPDKPLLHGVLGIVVLCCLEVISAYLCRKSKALRRVMEGRPLVLMCRGKIEEKNMDSARVSTDELFAAIRGAGYRGPEEISYVILEQNGILSVIPKPESLPPTAEDMAITIPDRGISHPLIIDGKVQERTLGQTGKNRVWLNKRLKELGLKENQVLFFCVDDRDNISYERKKV